MRFHTILSYDALPTTCGTYKCFFLEAYTITQLLGGKCERADGCVAPQRAKKENPLGPFLVDVHKHETIFWFFVNESCARIMAFQKSQCFRGSQPVRPKTVQAVGKNSVKRFSSMSPWFLPKL